MQKRTIIKRIKTIIENYGSFTTGDVSAESSPCIATLGGCTQLLESFSLHKATAITYDRIDEEIDENYIPYENLSKDILEEILILAEQYEAEEIQTLKRISN